jgi:hypothetical protein
VLGRLQVWNASPRRSPQTRIIHSGSSDRSALQTLALEVLRNGALGRQQVRCTERPQAAEAHQRDPAGRLEGVAWTAHNRYATGGKRRVRSTSVTGRHVASRGVCNGFSRGLFRLHGQLM